MIENKYIPIQYYKLFQVYRKDLKLHFESEKLQLRSFLASWVE